jgi:hypothetical protein
MPVPDELFGGDSPNGVQSEDSSYYKAEPEKLRAVCGVKSWIILEGEASCVRS